MGGPRLRTQAQGAVMSCQVLQAAWRMGQAIHPAAISLMRERMAKQLKETTPLRAAAAVAAEAAAVKGTQG